jgi:hypothetical protein
MKQYTEAELVAWTVEDLIQYIMALQGRLGGKS